MSSRRPPISPYELGVAHLKRSEHAEALAAFSQAIELDPNEANAFVGRALALRALGNDTAALEDERVARSLGGPDRSAWDRLVKRAIRQWRGDLSNSTWLIEDPLSRAAYLLLQFTWQIYNGGLVQWVANGYAAWAEDVARAADAIGTGSARVVASIVREMALLLARWPDARPLLTRMIAGGTGATERIEALFKELARFEERYARAGTRPGEFVADVEAWFEQQVSALS